MSAENYGLERGAQAVLGQRTSLTYDSRAGEMAIALSTAISLKRIADALTLPGPVKGEINLADVISGIEQNTRDRRA